MMWSSFFLLAIWLHLRYVTSDISNNRIGLHALPSCDAVSSSTHISAPVPISLGDLDGKWLSQKCEARPGPKFAIRSYNFTKKGVFTLDLHYYEDPACSRPSFSLGVQGHVLLERPSLLTPGGTEADYSIRRLTVVSHTQSAIEEIIEMLNRTGCPATVYKRMEVGSSSTVYDSPWTSNKVPLHTSECLLIASWHELQLMRVEKTPLLHQVAKPCGQLFLGDLHSDPGKQNEYRPTAYQDPLINSLCISKCKNCQPVDQSSLLSPPILREEEKRIYPPPLIKGSWASVRCEVQSYGFFLKRLLAFSSYRPQWHLQQSYYDDPECRNATYTIQASGTYKNKGPSPILDADEYDLTITKMSITPHSKSIATQLNKIPTKLCGQKGAKWGMGKRLDITKSMGCPPIGLKVPSREPEILRLVEQDGKTFLYLGQTRSLSHQDKVNQVPLQRPTSFSPGLQRCREIGHKSTHSNLIPQVGAITASASCPTLYNFWLITLFISFINTCK